MWLILVYCQIQKKTKVQPDLHFILYILYKAKFGAFETKKITCLY